MANESKYSTRGGLVTRSETFTLILHHIDELRNQFSVMSHLENTEDSNVHKLMAKGWLAMEQLMAQVRVRVVKMAQNKLN